MSRMSLRLFRKRSCLRSCNRSIFSSAALTTTHTVHIFFYPLHIMFVRYGRSIL